MTGVPFFSLQRLHSELRPDLDNAIARVLDRGNVILGEELLSFECEFAAYCGATHAIGVGNGLDALALILRGLDVSSGSEVIVPGHTFIATWLAVSQVGATIVPVDIDSRIQYRSCCGGRCNNAADAGHHCRSSVRTAC